MTQNTPSLEATRTTRKAVLAALACGAIVLAAGNAAAFTTPAAGTFAYDLYDIGVLKVLNGPIGFVGGVGAMCAAGILAIRQMILPAVGTVLGGAFLLKADSVVTTLGALVV